MLQTWILAGCLAAAPLALVDDADSRAAYIDGLHSRQLHDLLVDEAQDFLDQHGDHEHADLVRYRLASALLELSRPDDAAAHFRRLSQRPGFAWRAAASLRLGQCELRSGRPRQAIAPLTAALEDGDPTLAEPATVLLADAWLRGERPDQALPLFDQALARWPRGAHARDAGVGRAWCCQRLGRHEDAVAGAEALLSEGVEPGSPLALELHFIRGESLAALGRAAEAEAAFALVERGPFADAALRGRGFAADEQDRPERAAAHFAALLARHPESRFVAEASFQLGVQRLSAGDAEGAWQALSSPAVPRSAEARYWQARSAGALGQTDEALRLLDEAEALEPEPTLAGHVQTARGDLLAASGRSAEAAGAYARAGSSDALHAAAVTSLNAGNAAAALQLADRALAAGGDDALLHLARGEALFALERPGEARPEFEQVIAGEHLGAQPRARSRLAWCAYQQGELADAGRDFESLAREHPSAPEADEAAFMTGRCRDELGDSAGAREAWTRYLAEHPAGAFVLEAQLGLAGERSPRERLPLLQAVVDGSNKPAQLSAALLQLGDTLAELGRPAEATPHLTRIIQQFSHTPSAPSARYSLAWLQLDAGDPQSACATLAPVLTPPRDGPAPEPELRLAAHELAAWSWCLAGQPDRAEAVLSDLARLGAEPARLLASARSVAAAYTAAGQPDRAQALMDALSSAAPDAQVEAAWIALDAGHLDDASTRARAALDAEPTSASAAEVAFFVGEAHFAAGDDAAAAPLFDATAAAGGELADEALYKSGFARLRAGDLALAAQRFDTLVAEHPHSALVGESLFLAGEACFRLGQFEQAAQRCRRVLSEHPRHEVGARARFRLGLSLAQLEQWQGASDALADLARRHSDFANLLEAELWRGRALAALGNGRAARAALERVVEQDRGVLSARARLELGHMHQAAGDTEHALSEYLKVAVLHASEDEVAQALLLAGDCLSTLGRADAATDRWRELLQRTPQHTLAADARRRLGGV